MSFIFLIPLAIAFSSAYIFKNCKDEVGTIIAVGGVVSLVLSLIFLPWQLKLFVVMVVLARTKRVTLSNE